MDEDLTSMTKEQLEAEVKKLRAGIRQHRDATGHNLCWWVPELWKLLPEGYSPKPEIPEWCEFMQNCAAYRASLSK
jgi:hypothetical protein